MVKKTGRKADFIDYGDEEVKTTINGKDIGVVLDKTTQSHYVMLPQNTGRTKRKWLGKDAGVAVIKFWATVAELKEEVEKHTPSIVNNDNITPIYKITRKNNPIKSDEDLKKHLKLIVEEKDIVLTDTGTSLAHIAEAFHIEWLKKELKNPSSLAKKTGISAFNHFYDWMTENPIKLSELIDNFFKLRKKPISHKEEQKTRKSWERFCKLINKKTVEAISLDDIQKFENYIHSKNYAPATIAHYLNRVEKVFSYNTEKYQNNDKLIKIVKWCRGMERLENNNSEAPEVISLEVFENLYNNTHILLQNGKRNSPNIDLMMKAMLTYSLNTASTPIDLSRLTINEIDLELRTLNTRRKKTGRIKKIAYLWGRTSNDLKAYLDSRTDMSPYVFLSRTGTSYSDSGIRKLFKRYRRELGLPDSIEFKHFRDTFSTRAKDLDIDPFKINCVMGHSNKGQVDRYSKRQITNKLKEACLAVEKDYFGKNS